MERRASIPFAIYNNSFPIPGNETAGIRKVFSTIASAFWKEKEKFIVRHPSFTSEIKQILAHGNSSCRHNSVTLA